MKHKNGSRRCPSHAGVIPVVTVERVRQTDRQAGRDRQRQGETDRDRDRQTDRARNTERETETGRERQRQGQRQTERQRQTDRQAETETETKTETERERIKPLFHIFAQPRALSCSTFSTSLFVTPYTVLPARCGSQEPQRTLFCSVCACVVGGWGG